MFSYIPVDSGAKGAGLIQAEARGEQGSLVQQQHQILDRLVTFVCICTLAQLLQQDQVMSREDIIVPQGSSPDHLSMAQLASQLNTQ